MDLCHGHPKASNRFHPPRGGGNKYREPRPPSFHRFSGSCLVALAAGTPPCLFSWKSVQERPRFREIYALSQSACDAGVTKLRKRLISQPAVTLPSVHGCTVTKSLACRSRTCHLVRRAMPVTFQKLALVHMANLDPLR